MFASIRRYRLTEGSMDELTRRVDEGFAEQVSEQPGFMSYEFLDCGDGEVMTISVFSDADGAEASRELAQRWTEENLRDLELGRIEVLRGEILVSRAAEEMLAPGHVGAAGRFGSVRRYRQGSGSVADLMHTVDERFADRIEAMDGFAAYHLLDCGGGEILSISLFRDQAAAEESDDLALAFVREELMQFDIERTEVIGGTIAVSRAMAQLLEPAHA
jgi:heme-degrading monooxygenase HmoA